MKKFVLFLLASVLTLSFVSASFAGRVSGYFRSNGTYVQPYYRSDSNSTVRDNYSYYGNVNPYTGNLGTNHYYHSSSSEYYRGYSPKVFGAEEEKE